MPMDELRTHCFNLFQWKHVAMTSADGTMPIRSEPEVGMAYNDYLVDERDRRRDVLEAVLESVRAALTSDDKELHYQGAHAMWELACDRGNHKFMSFTVFECLGDMLRSSELRVQSLAAATIWRFCDSGYSDSVA